MKKHFIIFAMGILIFFTSMLYAQTNIIEGDVRIILFDISKSMVGYGDGNGIDIFNDVKEATSFIINDLNDEDYLMILPYHAGLDDRTFGTKIKSEKDKKRAIQFVNQLTAIGLRTWLTQSYSNTIKKIDNIKDQISDNSDIDILILTDGKGNGREDIDPQKGQFYLDNFIKQHNLTKNDYPFLLTKFVTVRKGVFTSAQKNTLKKNDVDTGEFTPKPNKIYISPEEVVCNSQNKNITLNLQFSNKLDREKIQLIEITNQYNITPSSVVLNKSRQQYSFVIEPIVSNPKEGKIEITSDNDQNIIYLLGKNLEENNIIPLKYSIKPFKIMLDTKKIDKLKNSGKIIIYFKTKQHKKIPTFLTLSSLSKDLQLSLKNDFLKSSKTGIAVHVIPKDKKAMKNYRWGLDKNKSIEMKLKVVSKDKNFKYYPNNVKFNIIVTQPFLKKILPFLIVLAILLILLIIFFISKKMITAKFLQDATLMIDVNIFSIRAKPFHKKVIVGTSGKSDIQISAILFNHASGKILEIYKYFGDSIKIQSINSLIQIEYGSSIDNFAIVEGNKSFNLIEGTDKINCEYTIT